MRLPSHLRGTQILPAKCPKHHERDIRSPWSLHLQDFKVNSSTLICHTFVVVAFKDNVLYIRAFIENAGLDTVNWSLECLLSFAIWPLAEDLFFYWEILTRTKTPDYITPGITGIHKLLHHAKEIHWGDKVLQMCIFRAFNGTLIQHFVRFISSEDTLSNLQWIIILWICSLE